MADYPYFPFWTDAYLADTQHLTTEEHGAYMLLLIQAWRSADCSLPDDDAMLARLCGLSASKWKAVKPIVMAFWKHDKRRKIFVQKRLRKEREKAASKTHSRRDAAASRWKERKSGDANAMQNRCYPEPEPYKTSNDVFRRARAPKKSGFVHVRKTTDAVNDFIQELGNEQVRIGYSGEGGGSDVPMLSAIGARRS